MESLDQIKQVSNLHYRLHSAFLELWDYCKELEEKKEDIEHLKEDINKLIDELNSTSEGMDIDV